MLNSICIVICWWFRFLSTHLKSRYRNIQTQYDHVKCWSAGYFNSLRIITFEGYKDALWFACLIDRNFTLKVYHLRALFLPISAKYCSQCTWARWQRFYPQLLFFWKYQHAPAVKEQVWWLNHNKYQLDQHRAEDDF